MTDARTLGDLAPLPADTSKQYAYKPGTGWIEVTIPAGTNLSLYYETVVTWAAGTPQTITPTSGGVGFIPRIIQFEGIMKVAANGLAIGENFHIDLGGYGGSTLYGVSYRKRTATNFEMNVAQNGLAGPNSAGTGVAVSSAQADIKIMVWGSLT